MPSPQIEDEIVDRWAAGEKADDIAEAVGVSRSTVYAVVRNRGMTTQRGPRTSGEIPVASVMSEFAAAQREIGRLQLRVEQLEDELAARRLRQGEPRNDPHLGKRHVVVDPPEPESS